MSTAFTFSTCFIPSSHRSSPSLSPRRPSNARMCIETPEWRRIAIDIDFAKDDKLYDLERNLYNALDVQDFATASNVRDELTKLGSGAYVAVLSTNFKFYNAFHNCSLVDMAGCWLQSNSITCKHPGADLAMGYADVLNSFGGLFSNKNLNIRVSNIVISLRGALAWVTCEEHVWTGEPDSDYVRNGERIMCATNIYQKSNAQWYICHHTAHPVKRIK